MSSKPLLLSTALICLLATNTTIAQILDSEKGLRQQRPDSLMGWNTGGVAALGFTQTAFVNWAAGGVNSIAGNSIFSAFANYKDTLTEWDNSIDLAYGLLLQGTERRAIKTDDKIDLFTKYGRRAFGWWYYAAMLNFRTQFDKGYNYPDDSTLISDFMAPAYLLAAVGLDYKPDNTFSLFLSPVSAKFTFVQNRGLANRGAYGVEPAVLDTNGLVVVPGQTYRVEIGGYVRAHWQRSVAENVTLNTRLDLFSNYLENPGNIDVNWEMLWALKVNRFLTATVSTQLMYDDDVRLPFDRNGDGEPDHYGPRIQFKEVIGIGLSYTF